MTYLVKWEGKTDPEDKSGTGHYRIEAQDFVIPLPTFADAQRLNELLWLAFRQGKQFAFSAIKSHVAEAMARADQAHGLSLPVKETSGG